MLRLLLIILFVMNVISVKAQDGDVLFDEAKKKGEEGKYKEALVLYTKAIEKDGNKEEYYIDRYYIYLNLKEVEKGFQDINTAIKINPKSYKAYAVRGNFYYLIKEAEKSIMDYTMAIENSPSDSLKSIFLAERSWVKRLNRDAKMAAEDCYLALKLDSLNLSAMSNLAMALDDLGKDEEVIKYLMKALAIDSTSGAVYMNIGFKLSKMGRYQESLKYIDKAIQLDPSIAYAYNNRGYVKLMIKDYNGALEDINKSIKMDPTNSYAYRNKGLTYKAQGKNSKACEEWENAIKYGFTKHYGDEVQDLLKANCLSDK